LLIARWDELLIAQAAAWPGWLVGFELVRFVRFVFAAEGYVRAA
jgi:hypothetical protein